MSGYKYVSCLPAKVAGDACDLSKIVKGRGDRPLHRIFSFLSLFFANIPYTTGTTNGWIAVLCHINTIKALSAGRASGGQVNEKC